MSVSPHNVLVFYAVRVVSKESKRLVLPRTSCYNYFLCLADLNIVYRNVVPSMYVHNRVVADAHIREVSTFNFGMYFSASGRYYLN
jgi:hypothetical protein